MNELNENKLAGVKISFPDGFKSYKKASVMNTETKTRIKLDQAKLCNVTIMDTGELKGSVENIKAFNEAVSNEFKKRLVTFKFVNFQAIPVEKFFDTMIKQLVIDAQKIRETKTDDEIVNLTEYEIDLSELFEKKTNSKTPTEKIMTQANKLETKEEILELRKMLEAKLKAFNK